MSKIYTLGSLIVLLPALAVPVLAGPIPASPSPVPSAGESALTSSFTVGSSINIDWEVIRTTGTSFSPGLYAYEYQIENTSASSGIDAFSITMSASALASIVGDGVLAGDNLDIDTAYHPGHNATNFPILATEQEGFTFQPLTNVLTTLNAGDNTITWSFSPLSSGNQSDTLYFLSTQAPTYGNAVSQDSIPPSPWTSLGPDGQQVPIPNGSPATPSPRASMAGISLLAIIVGSRFTTNRRPLA